MRAFHIAGILSVVLPFAAIGTANAAGIVSHNGGHSIRTASADLLAGPGRNGKKNRGFRFAAPSVVGAARHSDAGAPALTGGTLTLSSLSQVSFAGGYTLSAGGLTKDGAGLWTLSGANTYSGATTVSGGTLSLSNGAVSAASGGDFYIYRLGNGTPTIDGGLILVGGPANTTAGGTLQLSPTTDSVRINGSGGTVGINSGDITNLGLSSGVVTSSGGTINFNGPIGSLEGGLLGVGSGTLTLVGGTVHATGLNVSGGTLTIETSQTLETLVIDSNGVVIGFVNAGAPPPPVGDASSQSAQPVPEPSAAVLLATSAAALLACRARNRNKAGV